MSVIEQLLFAILGVTILTASLALSDPHLRLASAFLRDGAVSQYSLQSCPSR
jgi:hypothetical protein